MNSTALINSELSLSLTEELFGSQVGIAPFDQVPDGCYLLHFDTKYQHAAHYIGWSPNVLERIEKHRAGQGAGLTRALKKSGIGFIVARVWWGKGHEFERALHDRNNSKLLCPVCCGEAALLRAKG